MSALTLESLTKEEREYVLTMAIIDCNSTEYPPGVEPKFSPLTHCALCGKMFPSIRVSVRNKVPIGFTISHKHFWNEPVCDC